MLKTLRLLRSKHFLLAFAIVLLCSIGGKYLSGFKGFSLVGHLVIALILGMILQVVPSAKHAGKHGAGFISNKFLRLGIIFLGFRLNLEVLVQSGIKTISLAILVVVFTIFAVYAIARLLKIEKSLALLSATGCGICGAAAVMGVSPSLKAHEDDSVLAIAVVCILGTVFTLLIVFLKPFINFTDVQYGVLAGASLHEIAHAVAAGAAGGETSEKVAIIVKLSRVLLLAPVAIIFGVIFSKQDKNQTAHKIPIPWFMLGFLISSAIGTFFAIPADFLQGLVSFAYILLGMAMAALGLHVDFHVIIKRGGRVFLAGFLGSVLLFALVFGVAKFFF